MGDTIGQMSPLRKTWRLPHPSLLLPIIGVTSVTMHYPGRVWAVCQLLFSLSTLRQVIISKGILLKLKGKPKTKEKKTKSLSSPIFCQCSLVVPALYTPSLGPEPPGPLCLQSDLHLHPIFFLSLGSALQLQDVFQEPSSSRSLMADLFQPWCSAGMSGDKTEVSNFPALSIGEAGCENHIVKEARDLNWWVKGRRRWAFLSDICKCICFTHII